MKSDKESPTRQAGTPGQSASPHTAPPGRAAGAEPRRIESSELFAGQTELTIVHASEHYRLRITRNDKLILTK